MTLAERKNSLRTNTRLRDVAFAPKGFSSFKTAIPVWLKEKLFQKDLLKREFKKFSDSYDWNNRLLFAEHHQSHAASAFYPSPFEDAAVLTMDGVGEWATTSVGHGNGSSLDIARELHFPHSLGLLYSAFTFYTGFQVNSGEYKVMGLAPYGAPRFQEQVATFLPIEEGGWYRFPMKNYRLDGGVVSYPDNLPTVASLFGPRFEEVFGPTRKKGEPLTQEHMDLAASVQRHCEEVIFHLLRRLHEEHTSAPNVTLDVHVACLKNVNNNN